MKILHLSDPTHGWINITFGKEPETYTVTASGVPNDCLLDLAAATIRIAKGSVFETVRFSLEPDFMTCRLQRESDSIRIVIMSPDHVAPVFEAAFSLQAFTRRLRFELLRIESRCSTDHGWTRPFPYQEVDLLDKN
ncbi:hypothetical protein JIN84_05275 [Luteolibacter yonseiensis]|uniref:Uncharacterized protein n=1 Tax=Luteolibacter yonseiensis TaxID=1144680 RepID=A0A934VAC7_9BACT|nr:hypothetical protein [Luteolibacter yonseiensis]MBK1815015.1 hypothetical protein [Luteolibacter yonseiensis]